MWKALWCTSGNSRLRFIGDITSIWIVLDIITINKGFHVICSATIRKFNDGHSQEINFLWRIICIEFISHQFCFWLDLNVIFISIQIFRTKELWKNLTIIVLTYEILWNFMKFRCDKKKSINLWQPYILQCSIRLLCEYISLWKPVSTILQQMNLVKSWLRFLLFPMFLSLHWNHVWLLSLFGMYIEPHKLCDIMVIYWQLEMWLLKYKPTLALISGPKRLPKGSVKDFSVVIALTLELFHFDILRPFSEYSSGTSSK